MKFKNALVSCSNKTGLIEFIQPLVEQGMRVVSTGGTANTLRNHGIPVVDVSEQTGFPEVMDGRVKTLHPKVHMALLGRNDNAGDLETIKKFDVEFFDLVVGNLYPFAEEPDIENIDIGGPSFLRAAGKSYSRIAVVCDPSDYRWILEKNEITLDDRKHLASKVFSHTSCYDSLIAEYLNVGAATERKEFSRGGELVQTLRYGENPSQQAAWYARQGAGSFGLHLAKVLQGKELSYNNLLDLDAAYKTLCEFASENAAVAVKHNNPCGVAVGKNPEQSLKKTFAADSQSVFGGVLATTFEWTEELAECANEIFLECILAPKFDDGARAVFAKKKNLRLLEWPSMVSTDIKSGIEMRTLSGGFLLQTKDNIANAWSPEWKIVSGQTIPNHIQQDLLMAWKVCGRLKSNAIAIASDQQTVGLGMGQVNRVDAVEHAIGRMQKFHPNVAEPVLASDAFFPFADSIERIAKAKIKYVIQPGGSIKDPDVIEAAKALGIVMVFTGQRHFFH
jgi:phosphoribosylaminoimidazolecarboxamide formyltransferase/IMP cyclohydrolase